MFVEKLKPRVCPRLTTGAAGTLPMKQANGFADSAAQLRFILSHNQRKKYTS